VEDGPELAMILADTRQGQEQWLAPGPFVLALHAGRVTRTVNLSATPGGIDLKGVVDETADPLRGPVARLGAAGFEAIEEFVGDGGGVGDSEFGAVGVEDLHEAAHVGALVLMGEVDCHRDGGDGVLGAVLAVGDGEGELDAADADAVDGKAAVVEFGLGVGEAHGGG
jgi:hypothetical protein